MQTLQKKTQLLDHLVALIHIDTLYRDLYHERAESVLQELMPHESYVALNRKKNTLQNLPNQIRNAIGDANWFRVRELSKEHETLKAELERTAELAEMAREIYAGDDMHIDPFSPGMNSIPGVSRKSLDALQQEALKHLEQLAQLDPGWKSFYRKRTAAFANHPSMASQLSGQNQPNSGQLESQALEALDEGNFGKLERLAEQMSAAQPDGSDGAGDESLGNETREAPECLYAFSPETISQAGALGLECLRVPSQRREFAPFCRFAWHPTFTQVNGNPSGVLRVPDLPFPQGTPDALKARVQLFAIHPMINSGGVRFLPDMVSEDVLVETFPEPTPGAAMPHSKLLDVLGLEQRNQTSRRQIEAALLSRGGKILEDELGLDPVLFKLVCITPDLHLRIGLERGWGQEKIWTHFDGYLIMMDGRLHALAGGDVRFGGVYDLLGLPRDYASDHVMTRFAVVQRQRMALW